MIPRTLLPCNLARGSVGPPHPDSTSVGWVLGREICWLVLRSQRVISPWVLSKQSLPSAKLEEASPLNRCNYSEHWRLEKRIVNAKCGLGIEEWKNLEVHLKESADLGGRVVKILRIISWGSESMEVAGVEVVASIFLKGDIDLILKIPPSMQYEDKWCWRGDIRGVYSVRNGYKLLTMAHDQGIPQPVALRVIWKLKIPPNIRNFLWRCLQLVIPTLVALSLRGLAPAAHFVDRKRSFDEAFGGTGRQTLSFLQWIRQPNEEDDRNAADSPGPVLSTDGMGDRPIQSLVRKTENRPPEIALYGLVEEDEVEPQNSELHSH
nr:uncharacterized protein LOC109177267 [Ipomoea batatas]